MTRFVFDLGDVALSKETAAAINTDIQKAVIVHLAGMHMPQPLVMKFPLDWLGFILRMDLEALQKGEQQVQHSLMQRGAM